MKPTSSQIKEQKSFEAKIKRTHRELNKLLGYHLEENTVVEIVSQWNRISDEYNNPLIKANKNEIEDEQNRLERIIKNLEKGIKGLKDSNNIVLKTIAPLIIHHIDTNNAVDILEKQVVNLRKKLACLMVLERNKYNKNNLEFFGLLKIFSLGKSYGLSDTGRANAGRGIKNKLFEFVKIITEISDNEKIRRNYIKYIKLTHNN